MIVLEAQDNQWIDILTAIGTVAAVVFAAFSAWTSKVSANAARDAVEEARLARRAELAPKLVLEKEFLDFEFFWPHPDSLNGEAVFLARKHSKDKSPAPPTFSLQNFGQSPAFEVTITWELEDPCSDFSVPERAAAVGLSVSKMDHDESGNAIRSLFYPKPGTNSGTGLPLYRKWTTDIANCSPGQKRVVDFPALLLNSLFLRGLQLGATVPDEDIVLTATVSCHSADNVAYERRFRWKAIPFYYGNTNPIVVHGHFIELPMLPKPKGPRVA